MVISNCALMLAALAAITASEPIPIINGVTAVPTLQRNGEVIMQNSGQYPYVVFIKTTEGHCAGVLVKDKVVLTAAHCSIELNTRVIAGSLDLHDNLLQYRQISLVESITKHRKYKELASGNVYDIAILWLSLAFRINKYVSPIKLAKIDHIGATAFVLGWGSTNTQKYSNLLLRADLQVLDFKNCKAEFKTRPDIKLKNSMLCAQHVEKKQTPCKGDSGGPLVIRNVNGDVLVGITSWVVAKNKTICRANYPAVFTRITKIRSWIKDIAEI